jgi:hypothetical protein
MPNVGEREQRKTSQINQLRKPEPKNPRRRLAYLKQFPPSDTLMLSSSIV